jgi:hypothetical protein
VLTVLTFLCGLFFGGLSGAVTYYLSADSTAAVLLGVLAAVCTWLFGPTVIFGDD